MSLVEVVAAEGVPGLLREGAVHDEVRRMARGIPDRQRDVALLATASDQLEQVVARRPGRGDRHHQRTRPVVAADHVRAGSQRARRLNLTCHLGRAPDPTSACPGVPPHPVCDYLETGGGRRHVQADLVADSCEVLVGEAFDVPARTVVGDLPGGRARTAVLGDDAGRRSVGEELPRARVVLRVRVEEFRACRDAPVTCTPVPFLG